MSHDSGRDTALRDALHAVYDDAGGDDADLDRLRASITRRAEPLLARRRMRRMRWPILVPVALAASVALVFALSTVADDPAPVVVGDASGLTVDEILDAALPEPQLRALLAGAAQAEELLLIAAADGQDGEPGSEP